MPFLWAELPADSIENIDPLAPLCFTELEFQIVAVQLLSSVQLFAIPWTAVHQASLSFTIS